MIKHCIHYTTIMPYFEKYDKLIEANTYNSTNKKLDFRSNGHSDYFLLLIEIINDRALIKVLDISCLGQFENYELTDSSFLKT